MSSATSSPRSRAASVSICSAGSSCWMTSAATSSSTSSRTAGRSCTPTPRIRLRSSSSSANSKSWPTTSVGRRSRRVMRSSSSKSRTSSARSAGWREVTRATSLDHSPPFARARASSSTSRAATSSAIVEVPLGAWCARARGDAPRGRRRERKPRSIKGQWPSVNR